MHPPGVLKGDFLSIMCSESIPLLSFICILLYVITCLYYNIIILLLDACLIHLQMLVIYLLLQHTCLLRMDLTSNTNRIIVAQLNINSSLRNKVDALKTIISGKIDVLVITKSKLDHTFHTNQFLIDGFSPPFRLDRNSRGGGVMIYARNDILCRELKSHNVTDHFEGIVLDINLRKGKWLLFGGYNPHNENISHFLTHLSLIVDHYLTTYENYLLIGDFNSKIEDDLMSEFCEMYNLTSLNREPTCFKIREVVNNTETFRFIPVEEEIISEKLRYLDKKKA